MTLVDTPQFLREGIRSYTTGC